MQKVEGEGYTQDTGMGAVTRARGEDEMAARSRDRRQDESERGEKLERERLKKVENSGTL